MSRVFIVSDPHFSHKRISFFCPSTRPDVDSNVMNQKMIHQWQAQVRPNDVVYILGDVFFCNAEEAIKIIDRLPGQKHLIFGNHDNVIHSNSTLRSRFVSTAHYKEVNIKGHNFILFHYPIHEWHKIQRGAIHCHGHIHSPRSGVEGRIVNVCMDSAEMFTGVPYALYPIEDVIAHALKQPVRGHHDKVAD